MQDELCDRCQDKLIPVRTQDVLHTSAIDGLDAISRHVESFLAPTESTVTSLLTSVQRSIHWSRLELRKKWWQMTGCHSITSNSKQPHIYVANSRIYIHHHLSGQCSRRWPGSRIARACRRITDLRLRKNPEKSADFYHSPTDERLIYGGIYVRIFRPVVIFC